MKISYQKRWDKEGTVYDQTISITANELTHLENAVISEISLNLPRKKEYVFTSGYEMFLKPLKIVNDKIIFLNHTQARFLNLFMKLQLKDRNTCLIIKK